MVHLLAWSLLLQNTKGRCCSQNFMSEQLDGVPGHLFSFFHEIKLGRSNAPERRST